VLPAQGIAKTLAQWPKIASQLAETKRKRKRFHLK
jgi:hypothetical protein